MRNMSEVDEIQWIRDDLKQPGKSQAGLARHMGWDPSVVSKILRGRRGLKVQEAAKIRAYFGAKKFVHGRAIFALTLFLYRAIIAPSPAHSQWRETDGTQ